MFLGNYFSYGDVNSEQYRLMILKLDNDPNTNIGGKLDYVTYNTKYRGCTDLLGANPTEEAFSFQVELIRPYDDRITTAEHQMISRDFFNSPIYKKLYIQDSEHENLYFNCYFTDVEQIEFAGRIGYRATVVCDSQYLWQDYSYTYTPNGKAATYLLHNQTSFPFYTYVDVTIASTSTKGNISISRKSEGFQTDTVTFSSVPANEVIGLYTNPKRVVSSNKNYTSTLFATTNPNWSGNWLRLTQGDNIINVGKNVKEITLTYKVARTVF